MKKKMPKPMRARPTMGPMTAPAIQALLSLFSSAGGGVTGVGVAVGVEETGVGEGIAAIEGPPVAWVSTRLRTQIGFAYLKRVMM